MISVVLHYALLRTVKKNQAAGNALHCSFPAVCWANKGPRHASTFIVKKKAVGGCWDVGDFRYG